MTSLPKKLEFMKRYQTEIKETTNSVESVGSRSDQYEDSVSEREDSADIGDHILKDTLKTTRAHRKWTLQILDDAKKTNLRLTGISEKSEGCINGILQNPVYRNNSRKFPKSGKRIKRTGKRSV